MTERKPPYRLVPEISSPMTHEFARQLLRRPNKRVYGFVWGRLVFIWDTKRPSQNAPSQGGSDA